MENEQVTQELLSFFKALADANRLKIIGVLSTQPSTVEQIAAILGLVPSTVSHHLSKLAEAGLVSATVDGYYNVYRLESTRLEEMSKRILSKETLSSFAQDVDIDAYDRKVLHDFFDADGRLKTIPAQRKKLLVILERLVNSFQVDRQYPEKEVNAILSQFHEDTASLRRELISTGFMARKSGVYWRIEKSED